MNLRSFFQFFALTLPCLASACATTSVVDRWADNFDSGRFKGGIYYVPKTYPLLQSSVADSARQEAVANCEQGRSFFEKGNGLFGQDAFNLMSSTYSVPMQYAERTIEPGDSAVKYATYLCSDAEPMHQSFALVYDERGPACRPIPPPFIPGRARIEAIKANPANLYCAKEGWVRVSATTDVHHIFLGDEGQQRCQQLLAKLIHEEVAREKFFFWVRNNLKGCPSSSKAVASQVQTRTRLSQS